MGSIMEDDIVFFYLAVHSFMKIDIDKSILISQENYVSTMKRKKLTKDYRQEGHKVIYIDYIWKY